MRAPLLELVGVLGTALLIWSCAALIDPAFEAKNLTLSQALGFVGLGVLARSLRKDDP